VYRRAASPEHLPPSPTPKLVVGEPLSTPTPFPCQSRTSLGQIPAILAAAWSEFFQGHMCRTDIPRPTTQVGTGTDYSVSPWDYSTWATRHLMAWSARHTED
jgi:hypothetical protein